MKKLLFTCLIVLLATLTAQAATDDVTINATNFPDANFRSYLLSLYPRGYMTQSDINSCTSLNVSSKSISNLTGIAHFTELQYLYCQNNNLSSLQLRNNTKLKTVEAYNNQLEWIDMSFCSKLEKLICNNNKLGQDPSNAAGLYGLGYSQGALNYLDFSYNYLPSLTLDNFYYLKTLKCSNNTTLTQLSFINCDLTTLDVTGCTGLTKLQCSRNTNLTGITGLSSCTAMTYLDCGNCAITDLSGVSGMTNLASLKAGNNNLTSLDVHSKANLEYLDVSNNTLLTDLRCYSCALTYLDVSGCTALTGLRCYYNDDLTTITGLANCTAITYLDCEDCVITSLEGVNNMTNIATLWARNNKLTSLAVTGKTKLTNLRVSGNTTLTTLNCNSNALTSLDVTGCTGLTQFQCYSNPNLTGITGLSYCENLTYLDMAACKFSTINVSALTKLITLRCNSNQLTSLNVSAMSSLKYIYCYGNNLTTLNVTGCTSLQGLRCYGNSSLATITGLANCTNITYLDCEDCAITELTGVNNLTNITTLMARNNQLTTLILTGKTKLTSLRVSGNTSLTKLYCYNNALTSLEVANCSAMTYLDCDGNNLTSLSVSGCTSLTSLLVYRNQITGTGMTTLVNSLPTRSASNKGTLYAIRIDNENEGNTMTASQITTARNKYWMPKEFNGSAWVDLTASLKGDVNNSNDVDINDVTALINYVLTGDATGLNLDAANVNDDNDVDINDVTALINYVLTGSW